MSDFSSLSSSVSGVGVPPAEGICDKAGVAVERRDDVAIFAPTAAPAEALASHKAIASPPSTETFFSFACAKNATHCPSGEKKGLNAPCVP